MDDDIKDQEASEPDGVPDNPVPSTQNDDEELPTVKGQPAPPRLAVGEVLLGRYEVTGSLGRGAMGVVLRCIDLISAVDVAVKALPPELSHNATEMADIRSNFQLIHRLHHPHIAGINVLDQDPVSGYYYLVMEYIEGVSLNEFRKQQGGRLSIEDASRILLQVAQALDYAHSKKVIHRDIKPANIMIQPDGTAKVLDFGIAAQLHSSMTRVSRHRYSSSGTAPYMAPEQWEGDFQNESTDQYALAVTAYEMLAGKRPFGSHDLKVMMASVLYNKPLRIDGLSRGAWAALNKALSKQRKHRFATCTDFALALGSGSLPERSGRGVTWKQIAATAAMLVSLALCGGVICRLHKSKLEAERARERTEQELDRLRRTELAMKHMSLGDIYREAQQLGDAARSYELAARSDPALPGLAERIRQVDAALVNRAREKQKTEAEKRQLLEQARTLVAEAAALREAGNLEEAAADYMAALKLLPGDEEIAKSVQAVRKDIEEREKAAEAERKRLAAEAGKLAAEAAALHKAGSLNDALLKYGQALEKTPADAGIMAAMQSVQDDIQKQKKEADALKRRIESMLAEVEVLKKQDNLKEALAKYGEIQVVAPEWPGLTSDMSALRKLIAEKAKAAEIERQKRQLVLRAEGLVAEAQDLRRKGDLQGALAKYEEARKTATEYPGLEAAITVLNAEIAAQALARQREALRKQVEAVIVLAHSRHKAGEYDKAVAECDRASLLNPEKPQADRLAALRAQAIADRAAAAATRAERDAEVEKTRQRVLSMMDHAADLRKNGNMEAGVTKYEAAAALCAECPELNALSNDIRKLINETEAEKKKVRRPRAH